MFNKRDASANVDVKSDLESDLKEFHESSLSSRPVAEPGARQQTTGRREAAVIGPSIHIDGDLRGDEDLVIDGEVKGAVHLRNNSLTIGSHGKVTADVYAHTIFVEGYMEGDLYGAERICIRNAARVRGNIASPRVSLEDGAKFKGSIEMDPEAEVLKKAFGENRTATNSETPVPRSVAKPDSGKRTSLSSTGDNASGKPGGVAGKEGSG
jgi:cytoskeletal protein CcmA (bactofilin family)